MKIALILFFIKFTSLKLFFNFYYNYILHTKKCQYFKKNHKILLLSPEKNIDIKWQVLNEYIGAYKGDDDFKEYMDKDKDGFITEADYNWFAGYASQFDGYTPGHELVIVGTWRL